MKKELYISGEEKEVNEVIEFVRPRIGKGKISIVDMHPEFEQDGFNRTYKE